MKTRRLQKFLQGGRIAKVRFIKRTTGEERVMLCRTGVSKGVKGAERPYDPESHGLVTVYDMQAGGFRNIPADAILEIKSGKRRYLRG